MWRHRDNNSRFGYVLPANPEITGYKQRTFHSVESRDRCTSFHKPNAFGLLTTDVHARIADGIRPDWKSAALSFHKDIDSNQWMPFQMNTNLGKVCIELLDPRLFEGRLQRLTRSSWLYRHEELADGANSFDVDGDADLFPDVDPSPGHHAVEFADGVCIEAFDHELETEDSRWKCTMASALELCESLEAQGYDEDGPARAGAAATAARLAGKQPPVPSKILVDLDGKSNPTQSWVTPAVPVTACAICPITQPAVPVPTFTKKRPFSGQVLMELEDNTLNVVLADCPTYPRSESEITHGGDYFLAHEPKKPKKTWKGRMARRKTQSWESKVQ